MKIRNIFFIFIISFTFNACVLNYPEYYKMKYYHSTEITNIEDIAKKLVFKMKSEILKIIPLANGPVYVIDFVNLENLKLTSQLGFLLSSEVKTTLSEWFSMPIKELEYTKYIQMGKEGTSVSSRDVNDLDLKEIKKTFAFVGTYSLTQRQAIFHLKLINMKNGNIIKMTSHKIKINDEILKLENNEEIIIRPPLVL